MKKIFAILLSTLVLSGCTLEEKILSSSTPETYYQTEQQCLTGLNGCYQPLRSIYGTAHYFHHTEVATDLMYYNKANYRDATSNFTPSSPEFGDNLWLYGYRGVMRCNAMYAAIERAPLTEEQKAPLFAECVVLRAFYYYILTINFGDVPFYTEEVTDKNNDRITHLPRMSAIDTRNALIDEVDYWLCERAALPMVRTYDTSEHRIGAAVGFYIAGKMCMWNNRWPDAIRLFGKIEDIYGHGAGLPEGSLTNYPLSDIPFGKKYVKESILEFSNTYNDYGYTVTSTLASTCTPSRSSTVSESEDTDEEDYADETTGFYYAGIGIPEMGDQQRTLSPMRPSVLMYDNSFVGNDGVTYKNKALMPYKSNDRRRAHYDIEGNLVQDGGGYLAWRWVGYAVGEKPGEAEPIIRWFSGLSSDQSRPYLGNKFWCFGMIYTYDSNNYKIFRYAGVLLSLAECHLRRGDIELACKYLNEVKSRANITLLSPSNYTEDTLLAEIQDECARELFGEFNRRHDLVRWGIWYDRCMKFGSSRLVKNIEKYPCRAYYPIPNEEVALSGGALDNDEYNKYGL